MPSSQGHHDTQRRIFRGKAGATDGRLPPKKNRRVKVKYQPEHSSDAGVDGAAHQDDSESKIEGLDIDSDLNRAVDQFGIDKNSHGSNDLDNVMVEINHLRKRISNIQTSLQTSRGLSNPKIWHTNCLLPVKNAVIEWRSICKYYFLESFETKPEINDTHEVYQTDAKDCTSHQVIRQETAVQVFSLIQMAMQSGPLVGSNPGYFKRCGGEVASVALDFLNEIISLASLCENGPSRVVDDSVDDELAYNEAIPEISVNEPLHIDDRGCEKIDIHNVASDFGNDVEISSSSASGSDHSSCSSANSHTSALIGNHEECNAISNESLSSNHDDSKHSSQSQAIQVLQTNLLFSEKQSQRLCQWIQNAQKAVQANKAPSSSAKKLQSQKSKKQQSKELKMERKLKKKKRSGGK
ncbi:hypothetical protein ACHAW6_014327 [Cyclotella cf. meneghiniana]